MPNSGRCVLVYLCAVLYAAGSRGDRHLAQHAVQKAASEPGAVRVAAGQPWLGVARSRRRAIPAPAPGSSTGSHGLPGSVSFSRMSRSAPPATGPGSPHLDHHLLAGAQPCTVHLRIRPGRQRLGINQANTLPGGAASSLASSASIRSAQGQTPLAPLGSVRCADVPPPPIRRRCR
jgi:hypothetical protein